MFLVAEDNEALVAGGTWSRVVDHVVIAGDSGEENSLTQAARQSRESVVKASVPLVGKQPTGSKRKRGGGAGKASKKRKVTCEWAVKDGTTKQPYNEDEIVAILSFAKRKPSSIGMKAWVRDHFRTKLPNLIGHFTMNTMYQKILNKKF